MNEPSLKLVEEDNLPLITIVTVVFNGKNLLEKTIQSVLSQTYPHIEYIIIDGGSKDGTVDIIKKYEDKLAYWISEPDKGVYDAMNKGIKVARGEWVQFLHCGDTLYSPEVINNIFQIKKLHADILYGDEMAEQGNGEIKFVKAPGDLLSLWKKPQFGHETMFTRTSLLKERLFNIKYKVVADSDFILDSYYRKHYSFMYTGETIVVVQPPGFSHKHFMNSAFEAWKIARVYKGGFKVNVYYFFTTCFFLLVRGLRWLLPDVIYKALRTSFRKLRSRTS